MLDVLDLNEWVSLFHSIIQKVLMDLCLRGKISKIPLCLMIRKKGGLNLSEIHEPLPRPNLCETGKIQCFALLLIPQK